jgi:hypothetical protein
MKKVLLSFLAVMSLALMACGPSKVEMQVMSAECDIIIEVRQVLNDSISLFVGNTLYLNSKQAVASDLFPMLVSVRDPMEIEKLTATDVVGGGEEFIAYLRKVAPDMIRFGLVIGETAYNESVSTRMRLYEKIKEWCCRRSRAAP